MKKDNETSIKVKSQFKKLIAFELLFQNLALLLVIPGAGNLSEETKQDIEEMKVCFGKLKIAED